MAEGAQVSEIWHSGKLRARQTAEIIARVLGVKKVIEKKGLKPDDDPAPIAEELKEFARQASRVTQDAKRNALRKRNRTTPPKNILIAGHLPFIPKLASLLKPDLGAIELKSGGVVRVVV